MHHFPLLLLRPFQGEVPAEPPPGGLFGGATPWIPLILIFAVFYFVMIVPERKNRRKRDEMLEALKKGDRIMTSGGMFGTIVGVQDNVVTLQIADGVRVRFSRQAVQTLAEEETDKEKKAE